MLVDDDRLILELYAMALRDRGYTVHEAGDAATARALAESERPRAACVDGRLASSSGAVLAEQLVKLGIEVIMFTNDQALYDRPPAGVAHCLIKVNTSPQDLAAELDQLLGAPPPRA